MADGIAVDITYRDDVSAALTRAIEAAIDLTPVMRDIAGHLADTTRERFETERGPGGVPWKPSRRAQDEGGQTLTDRGDLRGSIRENWGADFAEAGPERSGGAAIYAAIHQFGGTIRPKAKKALSFGGRVVAAVVIPARPYLGFDQVNADYTVDAIGRHLAHALGGGAQL